MDSCQHQQDDAGDWDPSLMQVRLLLPVEWFDDGNS